MNSFKFTYLGSSLKDKQKVEIYRFRNLFNDFVIVEIFHYKFNVYAIKFYLKKHSLSSNKYNLVYPLKFKERRNFVTGNSNFIRTLNSIVLISLKIIEKDKLASFGFLGAPKMEEKDVLKNKKNINSDFTVANTVRYRVYFSYTLRKFNPTDFEYIVSKSSSLILLRNNNNKEVLSKPVAEKYIVNDIIPNLN